MDSFNPLDGSKSSLNGSGSDMVRITDMLRKKISLEPPAVAFSGESRYLTPLWVFENGESRQELHRSDSSQPTISSFESKGNTSDPHHQNIQDRIKAALKLLTFREPRVLVQFWSPRVVGKHQLLTTFDQPFGLGVIDEGLCWYRRDSERNPFLVEKDNEEEDHSPLARVFRREFPEWTSDITNYLPTDFPQQECAIRCNLHGYLALPVFNSTTGLCVGVLELLMSSEYTSYTYEVQQVHNAMKTADLTTPQALHSPTLNVQNGNKQEEFDIIVSTLKAVCEIHELPLAQTWAISPLSSFASYKQCLTKSCNSFDNRCLGKVCMSTTGLPFHVQDSKMWHFWKACRERHVDNSRGYVGTALLSRGSCFCGDVTKLSKEEYPLVYNAQMSRLTSCFAVFLHNNVKCNSDYVLELFLKDSKCVPDVVQTLKQEFEAACGFELGDTSTIQVVGPSTEVNKMSFTADPHSIQMFSTTTTKTRTESLIIPQVIGLHMDPSLNIDPDTVSTSTSYMDDNFMLQMDSSYSDSISSMATTCHTNTDTGEVKQGRKRKIDSVSVQPVAGMVEAKATFNKFVIKFLPSIPMLLSDLKSEVAKRFNLEGKEFKLRYRDEENDWILICNDDDLKLALDDSVSSNSINLICESD